MVTRASPPQVGWEVKECSSVNVQEVGITEGEAEFLMVSVVKTRLRTRILGHVRRPQLIQLWLVSG